MAPFHSSDAGSDTMCMGLAELPSPELALLIIRCESLK